MPYNGSGAYTNPYYPTQDRDNAIPILASKFEDFFQVDLPATFGLCVTRDSQGVMTSNFNFNSFKGINLADPVLATDAVNKQTFDSSKDLTDGSFWIGNTSNLKEEITQEDLESSLGVDVLKTQVITGVLHVRDERASGTNGGSSSSGTQTRVLNTIKTNTIAGASLSSNQITLPAGNYKITGTVPAFQSRPHKGFLYNVTDAANEIIGTNAWNNNSDSVSTLSHINGTISINDTKVFDIRHYIETGSGTNGLGVQIGIASVEVYSDVFIEKIGE